MQRFSFPKVELHCHLEGVARLSTVYEIAQQKRGQYLTKECTNSQNLEIKSIEESWTTFDEFKALVTISDGECDPSLNEFLNRFKYFIGYIQGDKDVIKRIVIEAIEDCHTHNVKYVEFRFSPFLLASAGIEPHQTSFGDVTAEDVILKVKEAMDIGEAKFNVKSRLILCNVIGFPHYSLRIAQLCRKYSDFIVGIDVAGFENGHVYSNETEQLQVKAMQYAIEHGINRTVHAGESRGPESIKNALRLFNPHRIGHGYYLVDDPELLERVKKEKIHIETCPCSCFKIGGFWNKAKAHPIKRFVQEDMNVSISTDDPGVFNNSIVDNYQLCSRLGLSTLQLMKTNLNAARSCFLPEEEKKELILFLETEYSNISKNIDVF